MRDECIQARGSRSVRLWVQKVLASTVAHLMGAAPCLQDSAQETMLGPRSRPETPSPPSEAASWHAREHATKLTVSAPEDLHPAVHQARQQNAELAALQLLQQQQHSPPPRPAQPQPPCQEQLLQHPLFLTQPQQQPPPQQLQQQVQAHYQQAQPLALHSPYANGNGTPLQPSYANRNGTSLQPSYQRPRRELPSPMGQALGQPLEQPMGQVAGGQQGAQMAPLPAAQQVWPAAGQPAGQLAPGQPMGMAQVRQGRVGEDLVGRSMGLPAGQIAPGQQLGHARMGQDPRQLVVQPQQQQQSQPMLSLPGPPSFSSELLGSQDFSGTRRQSSSSVSLHSSLPGGHTVRTVVDRSLQQARQGSCSLS